MANMDHPLITIYAPERHGGRWVARADIRAQGETIQLQATASDRLAKRARDWYNRASSWVGERVELKGFGSVDKPPLEKGVFCDVPCVAQELSAATITDADIEHAASLYQACLQGHPEALEQFECILRAAPYDPAAADALEHVQVVEAAIVDRAALPIGAIVTDAAAGSPHARKMLAALQATAERGEPVRLSWLQDDYLRDHAALTSDLKDAASAQVGRRLSAPGSHRRGFERIRPSLHRRAESHALQMPMLRAFQQIDQAYTF